MSPTLLLLILAIAIPCTIGGTVRKPTCNDFSKNAEFNEPDAVATWHLHGPEFGKGARDAKCLQFSTVDEKERKNLEDNVGKYIPDIIWQNVTLKMQIPCTNSTRDKTQSYYLERLDGVGSYKTLDMPSPIAKLDPSVFHRYPMRLKSVSEHLAMMDCHEHFVFLLGKKPQAPGAKLDDGLAQIVKDYWIEE